MAWGIITSKQRIFEQGVLLLMLPLRMTSSCWSSLPPAPVTNKPRSSHAILCHPRVWITGCVTSPSGPAFDLTHSLHDLHTCGSSDLECLAVHGARCCQWLWVPSYNMGTILTRSRSEVTKCLSVDEWIRKLGAFIPGNAALLWTERKSGLFADAQMGLESIVLGGAGQSDGDGCCVILLICGI